MNYTFNYFITFHSIFLTFTSLSMVFINIILNVNSTGYYNKQNKLEILVGCYISVIAILSLIFRKLFLHFLINDYLKKNYFSKVNRKAKKSHLLINSMQIGYLIGALFSLILIMRTFEMIQFDKIKKLVLHLIMNKIINTSITYLDLLIILLLFNIILFLVCSSFYIELIILSSIKMKQSIYKVANI